MDERIGFGLYQSCVVIVICTLTICNECYLVFNECDEPTS